MFGKIFASLYTGSMIGAGPVVFALMPYIIANAVPDKRIGAQVELNPVLLSAIIGTSPKEIEKAIEFLCQPDPKSRSPDEGGRRLIRLGTYDYRVVNYLKYRRIRDEEERREANRINQQNLRDRKKARRTKREGIYHGDGEKGLADISEMCGETELDAAQEALDKLGGQEDGGTLTGESDHDAV